MTQMKRKLHHLKHGIHDNYFVAAMMSLLGGFLDAYTYLLKDGVFANAQTGNVVLLFISFLYKSSHRSLKYLFPIILFSLGILTSQFVKKIALLEKETFRIKMILLTEAILLSLIGIWGEAVSPGLATCIISFLAALQVDTFNTINGAPYATTMITGNLKSSMIQLHTFLIGEDSSAGLHFLVYISIILLFGAGVCIGTLACRYFHEPAIFLCLIFIFLAFIQIKEDK